MLRIRCQRCNKLLATVDEHENPETEIKLEWVCSRCKKYNKSNLVISKENPASAIERLEE